MSSNSFAPASAPTSSPDTSECKADSDSEDEYTLSAYGDVSLTDAYVIPGTPSTKKPRLKPKIKKPPLPGRRNSDDEDEEDDSEPFSPSLFFNYLRTTSTRAAELTSGDDFKSFFDTLKNGRDFTRKQKIGASSKDNSARYLGSEEQVLKSSGSKHAGKQSSGNSDSLCPSTSRLRHRRLPLPPWDEPA